ncbi:hypothetical protein ACA373_09870 [Erwinia sp. STN24]
MQRQNPLPGEEVAFLLEYIGEDIGTGLNSCEPVPESAQVKNLNAVLH